MSPYRHESFGDRTKSDIICQLFMFAAFAEIFAGRVVLKCTRTTDDQVDPRLPREGEAKA